MDPRRNELRYQWDSLCRNVGHLREVGDRRGMVPDRFERGEREARIIDVRASERQGELLHGTMERGNEIAVELGGNIVRLAEVTSENGQTLCALLHTADRSQAVLVDIYDTGVQSLTVQTASLGVLLDIEHGVRNIQKIGIEQTRLLELTVEEVVRTRNEIGRQGELTRDETERQGELTRAQDRKITELLNKSLINLGILGGQNTEWLNQGMERRHQEILKHQATLVNAAVYRLRTEAEERYGQAVLHFKTGQFGRAIETLDKLFDLDGTHVPGWVLFGDLAYDHGVPELARVAYHDAANYALVSKNMEGYVAAIIRLAQLERTVGNHEQGIKVIKEAFKAVEWGSPLCNVLRYEEVVALYADPKRTADLQKFAGWLRNVLIADPSRRDAVAADPFWAKVVAADPYLRYGNAPYIRLAEMWMGFKPEQKPCANPDVYAVVLEMCELGRKSHPQSVRDHLIWLQEQLPLIPSLSGFADGYEQVLLYLFKELRSAGKCDEAWQVFERGSRPEMFLPRVAYELFKRELEVTSVTDDTVLRVKTELRRILRAVPELRDEVASSDLFTACRERCKWLATGNTPTASLIESMSVLHFNWSDEEDKRIPSELWESFHALEDLFRWTAELVSEPVAEITGFSWRFGKDAQKVKALVGEVEVVIHRCANKVACPRGVSVRWAAGLPEGYDNDPYSVERWCAVVGELQVSILLSELKANSYDYGWNDDHEQRLELLLKLDPTAQKQIDQSPFFARLREVRADEIKRKRDAEIERQRLEALRLVAEEAERERLAVEQAERERLDALARQAAEKKALVDAEAAERKRQEAEHAAAEALRQAKAAAEKKRLADEKKERAKRRAENRRRRWKTLGGVCLSVLLIVLGFAFIPGAQDSNSLVCGVLIVASSLPLAAVLITVEEFFVDRRERQNDEIPPP